MSSTDLTTAVGGLVFPNPIMTASGTAGYGDELGAFQALDQLGAVVTKSLHADSWDGNPAPRVHPTAAGMLNSVGLQGPGVDAWITGRLPALLATGARVVASIWGRSIEDYRRAADALAKAPAGVVAVEVNLSCPNVESRKEMFAHDPALAAEAMAATAGAGRPRWAKLSPNVTDLQSIVGAVAEAGADAVTLTNTVMGMAIDVDTGRPSLGAGAGGLSGPAIHPVAIRAVYETRAAFPHLPIVGVGGVASGVDAIEFLQAGANAVQVGTATFADPAAPTNVLRQVTEWCERRNIAAVDDLIGRAHGR